MNCISLKLFYTYPEVSRQEIPSKRPWHPSSCRKMSGYHLDIKGGLFPSWSSAFLPHHSTVETFTC